MFLLTNMNGIYLSLDAKIGESALKMAVNNISFGSVRGYTVETTVKKETALVCPHKVVQFEC